MRVLLRPTPAWLCALVLAACGSDASSAITRAGDDALDAPFDAEAAWSRLQRIVAFGPRPSGSASLERLRAYLESELAGFGLEPRREPFRKDTPIGALAFENLWAELPGRSERTIVLASHIDTKRLPFEFVGANDSGSSTAVLLELARRLASGGPRALTYRFLFLDGEESIELEWVDEHSLYGSRAHVAALQADGMLSRIGALVLLDMVGDPELRFERDSNSHPEVQALFLDAAQRMGRTDLFARHRRPIVDDHVPFAEAGVPSIDLIDLDYGPSNAWHHAAEDVLANCSSASLETTGRLVWQALPALESWVQGRQP